MKLLKRFLAVILTVTIVCSSFVFAATASENTLPDYTMTQAEWDAYWEAEKGDNTKIALTPGADITELNFNWHSEVKLEIPKVRISENADMSDYTEFKGYATLAESGFQTNRVTVTGLEENTKYYYTYSLDKDNWSDPEFYRTLSDDAFKALLISDIQIGADDDGYGYANATAWNTLLNTALRNNDDTSFIISCGDQINSGESTEEWASVLLPEALRNMPMSTCIGNHDKKGYLYRHYVNNPNEYQSIIPNVFGNQYYYRYGDVLFVNFNSTSFNIFAAYNVAEKAIKENPDAKWRVAIFHHDVYGTGHHAADDDNYLLQGIFSSILDKFDFDLAFTGHEHYYGRSYNMKDNEIVPLDYTKNSAVDPDGTLYITTASASGRNRIYDEPFDHPWLNFEYMSQELIYSTVEFTDTTFRLETYTVEGDKLIDEYTITKTDTTYEEIDESENILSGTNAVGRVLKHFMGEYYVIIEVLVKVLMTALSLVA